MNTSRSIRRTPSHPGRLLVAALAANAIFSGTCGALLVIAPAGLDRWLGLDQRLMLAVGASLIGFASLLLYAVMQPDRPRSFGRSAVVADMIWIAGAAGVIVLGDVLSTRGNVVLALVTAVVAILAAAQWLGLRDVASTAYAVTR